jgi:hypothetical protein
MFAVSAALERMFASRESYRVMTSTVLKATTLPALGSGFSPDNPAWRRRAYGLSRDAVLAGLATL